MARRRRPLDVLRLYQDHDIPYLTEGTKHCQTGWIQIVCPFCTGNPGWHLGYNLHNHYFNCWRCGAKNPVSVIEMILRVTPEVAYKLLLEYKGSARLGVGELFVPPNFVDLPPETIDLTDQHRRYIKDKRHFKPKSIQRLWDIRSTGPVGRYKHRIMIPIYLGGMLISYQGRDVTDKASLRYKACRKELEVVRHKHTLYGIDLVPFDAIVITEGVLDVWRLGPGAVSTFGIEYTNHQISLMLRYNRRFIFYDNRKKDPQAGKQADKLAYTLDEYPGETEVIELSGVGDPAEMQQAKADQLMQDLGVR